MSVAWTDTVKEIAGIKLHLARAGSGPTVLVLHHDIGTVDRLPFYDALAAKFDVVIPHHPGWGKSERPQWLRHPRDIAAMLCVAAGGPGGCPTCRWSDWVSAAGSRPKWRARRRPHIATGAGGRDGHQAAGGRHRRPGDRFVHRLSAVRLPRPGGVRARSTATSPPTSWRRGTSRARWFPHRVEAVHVLARPCRICWAACGRRRWWSGATTTGSCRSAPARPTRRRCRLRRWTTVPACGHFVDMEKPDAVAKLAIRFPVAGTEGGFCHAPDVFHRTADGGL